MTHTFFHSLTSWFWSSSPGVWLAALGTLAIYSVLYKENPVYRFAEHIFIGAAAGYSLYITWTQILRDQWWTPIMQGQWYWIITLVIGAMFYFVFSQKHMWISRLVFGTFMGLFAGMQFKAFAGMNIDQIRASFKPLYVPGNAMQSVNNILFVLILLTVMSYFFFSFEHKNKITAFPSKVGRWVLMFAFGAMFGATVMARMSLLIGRVYFLLHNWMHIAK